MLRYSPSQDDPFLDFLGHHFFSLDATSIILVLLFVVVAQDNLVVFFLEDLFHSCFLGRNVTSL